LSNLFFGRETAHELCSKIVLKPNFAPLFERLVLTPGHWIFSVENPTRLERKCPEEKPRETEKIVIRNSGILIHPTECDLIADQFVLYSPRQYESQVQWSRAPFYQPDLPMMLSPFEMSSFDIHREEVASALQEIETEQLVAESAGGVDTRQLTERLLGRARTKNTMRGTIGTVGCAVALLVIILGAAKWRSVAAWVQNVICTNPTSDTNSTALEGGPGRRAQDGQDVLSPETSPQRQREVRRVTTGHK
jgi:hypothetical protein